MKLIFIKFDGISVIMSNTAWRDSILVMDYQLGGFIINCRASKNRHLKNRLTEESIIRKWMERIGNRKIVYLLWVYLLPI